MYVTVGLTAVPPYVITGRNDLSSEPLWHLEIWPNKDDGSEAVAFTADSLDALDALGRKILEAVEARRREGE